MPRIDDIGVNVPGTPNPLADNDYAELCALVHPLESSSDFGVDIYLECLQFVHRKLHVHASR